MDVAPNFRTLQGLAGVAGAQGEPLRAAKLFGAAEALRAAINSVFAPADRAEYERNLAYSRTQLGEEAWQAAWEEGWIMTMEQAVAHAFTYAQELEDTAHA